MLRMLSGHLAYRQKSTKGFCIHKIPLKKCNPLISLFSFLQLIEDYVIKNLDIGSLHT